MNVELAVVADYANIAEGGKLNVMGIFDQIYAPAFPSAHAYMVLAFRIRVEFDDQNAEHKVEIELLDEDGHRLGGGGGKLAVGAIKPGERQSLSQILPFPGIVFPHAGEYSFTIRWDGNNVAKIPISLVQLESGRPS